MDLHQMEYFITVCDCGGITPAAESLFHPPQPLSNSIHRLEEELQCPLFAREKSGLVLTPFGRKALEEMRRLAEEYHTVKQRLGQMAAQEKGRIRISCGYSVPNALPLEELRAELLGQGISLDIMELPDLLAEEMVYREVADIGLTIGCPHPPELFQYTLLRRYHLCAVMNQRHPLARKETVSVRDLAGEQVVTKSPYFNSYHILENEAQRQGLKLSYVLQSPDEIRYLQLIDDNEGVGIGLTFIGIPKLQVSQTAVFRPFEEDLPWEVYLITRKGHYLSPAAQALVARLRSWQKLP